jgi:ABC-type multidrug transport system fused ATPase/permease subunit
MASMVVSGLLLYGGYTVISGERTSGYFMAFLVSVFLMYEPFKKLTRVHATIQQGLAGAQRIFEVLDTRSSIVESSSVVALPGSYHLEFHDVSFEYPARGDEKESSDALSQISLAIPEGKKVALVGFSGAGKSTLVDVILGIQEPSEGVVEISGVRPQDAITKWPGAISYLPQEVVLSRGTIKSNITLGYENESVSTERILNTLKIAQLESMIDKLPRGIYSEVHDRGENFSGGQKQRIGIARALYSNPKLLVLDESTSALDNDTESAFTLALKVLKGTATIIVIAHKLSSIVDYDCIYYLENGEIKGSGTFNELKQAIPNFAIQAERVDL